MVFICNWELDGSEVGDIGFIALTTRAHDASNKGSRNSELRFYNSGDVVYSAPKYNAS